jgi:hypothetical protein
MSEHLHSYIYMEMVKQCWQNETLGLHLRSKECMKVKEYLNCNFYIINSQILINPFTANFIVALSHKHVLTCLNICQVSNEVLI